MKKQGLIAVLGIVLAAVIIVVCVVSQKNKFAEEESERSRAEQQATDYAACDAANADARMLRAAVNAAFVDMDVEGKHPEQYVTGTLRFTGDEIKNASSDSMANSEAARMRELFAYKLNVYAPFAADYVNIVIQMDAQNDCEAVAVEVKEGTVFGAYPALPSEQQYTNIDEVLNAALGK